MRDNSPKKIDMTEQTLTINRTVDGEPVGQRTSTRRRKSNANTDIVDSSDTPKKFKPKSDPYIWGIYILLIIVAIIELFSASSGAVKGTNVYAPLVKQLVFIALGFGCIMGLQKIHYAYIGRFAAAFAIFSGLLLLYANTFGPVINGAQRAIFLGPITIQPPEIAKLAVVVVLASILGKNQQYHGVSFKGVLLSSIVIAVFAALTYRNGLTNMVIIMGVCLVMALVGGIPFKKLLVLGGVFGIIFVMFTLIKSQSDKTSEFDEVAKTETVNTESQKVDRTELREGRIKLWMKGVHPDDKINDNNRQDVIARMAQAHGGIYGKGPGNSRESSRLPLAYSDFIYSIIVEDTGLIGGVALIVLYLCLMARAGVLAWRFKRAFPAFMIMGCATLIVFQALIHMAIVTGAMPNSGQPLPFISAGGTSVIVMSIAIGIMLSVSRHADTISATGQTTQRENISDIPEEYQAANITSYNNQ